MLFSPKITYQDEPIALWLTVTRKIKKKTVCYVSETLVNNFVCLQKKINKF